MKISYSNEINRVFCLLYGRSKLGKTPLAATAPAPIFLDVEKRMISLSGKEVPRIEIEDYKDVKKAVKFLNGPEGKKYKTVVVDSLSELAQMRYTKHDDDEDKLDKPNKYAPFSKIQKDVLKTIRLLRTLKQNVICICKLRPYEVDDIEKNRPAFPGRALGSDVPYLFDCVFALVPYESENDDKKPKHERGKLLLTKPVEQYEAGSPDTLDKFEVLNMTTIFEKLLKPEKRKKKK